MKKKLAVFGHPVAHSLSPAIHQAFANQFEMDIQYDKIDPGVDGFEQALSVFHEQGGCGGSVTLPFKDQAYQLASQHTPTALAAGAANTVWWNKRGELAVGNTDGLGLVWDLQQRLSVELRDARILVIGAGGAAAGIVPSLLVESPKQLIIANRTLKKAQALVDRQSPEFADRLQAVSLDAEFEQPMDLVIQATSLGHQGLAPKLSPTALGATTFCYDLSYGHAAEPFLEWAASQGVLYRAGGIGMLVAQAALQFERWFGQLPDARKTLLKISSIL